MKKINFTKMHGIGNDYVYIDRMDGSGVDDACELALKMSPRHFSVGSDGVIFVCPAENPENDGRMRMFNADGSEGKMCGNGIRCVGKFLYDHGYAKKDTLRVETLSGVKILDMKTENGEAVAATVDMGKAILSPSLIPVISDGDVMVNKPVSVNGKTYNMTAVSMGNPHSVIFMDEIKDLDLEKIGPSFENHEIFPERVNTEFVKVIDRTHLEMRVWERGSGETYACGTGTCATAVASILNGYCDYDTPIDVKLIGGTLTIVVKKDLTVFMTGAAETVYEGTYFLK